MEFQWNVAGDAAEDPLTPVLACPSCGALMRLAVDEEPEEAGADDTGPGPHPLGRPGPHPLSRSRKAAPSGADPARDLAATVADTGCETMFQPGIMMRSILDGESAAGNTPSEVEAIGGSSTDATDPSGDTDPLAEPGEVIPPPVPEGVDAFFLILGAPKGREKLRLSSARTVIGRKGADLTIDDVSISSQHFQVDVMGDEFFVRDLESQNGTFINGRRVRYCQLLPGDEVLVGRTVLAFRRDDDGVDERRTLG